jgi:hypothetical protein
MPCTVSQSLKGEATSCWSSPSCCQRCDMAATIPLGRVRGARFGQDVLAKVVRALIDPNAAAAILSSTTAAPSWDIRHRARSLYAKRAHNADPASGSGRRRKMVSARVITYVFTRAVSRLSSECRRLARGDASGRELVHRNLGGDRNMGGPKLPPRWIINFSYRSVSDFHGFSLAERTVNSMSRATSNYR